MKNDIFCSIHSLYQATEGEGAQIGMPQVFVRFQGCAVGCVNCDSMETWDFNVGQKWTIQQVVLAVEKWGLNRVSITGGDPLHPKHVPAVLALVSALKQSKNYYVNIEAAGTRVVPEIFDLVDYISYDLKTPSTKVKTSLDLLIKMVARYPLKYQVKSVVQDREDFDYVWEAFQRTQEFFPNTNLNWVITPAYGTHEEFPRSRFIDIQNWNYEVGGIFRVIGQQHKWIYGPKEMLV